MYSIKRQKDTYRVQVCVQRLPTVPTVRAIWHRFENALLPFSMKNNFHCKFNRPAASPSTMISCDEENFEKSCREIR